MQVKIKKSGLLINSNYHMILLEPVVSMLICMCL